MTLAASVDASMAEGAKFALELNMYASCCRDPIF